MGLKLVLNVFGSGVFVGTYFMFCGSKIFREKIPKKPICIFIWLFLVVFNATNFLLLDTIWKTAFSYLKMLFDWPCEHGSHLLQCTISSFVAYVLLALGEVSFIAVLALINLVGVSINIADLSGGSFTNLIIVLFSIIYLYLIYKPLNKILNKIRGYNKIILIIAFILLVTVNCTLFYKLYFHNSKILFEYIQFLLDVYLIY